MDTTPILYDKGENNQQVVRCFKGREIYDPEVMGKAFKKLDAARKAIARFPEIFQTVSAYGQPDKTARRFMSKVGVSRKALPGASGPISHVVILEQQAAVQPTDSTGETVYGGAEKTPDLFSGQEVMPQTDLSVS